MLGVLLALLSLLWLSACSSEDSAAGSDDDGTFGTAPTGRGSDAGIDGAVSTFDASAALDADAVRVRFVHGSVNLGTLTVCHDPDGPGPRPATMLADNINVLRADFAGSSNTDVAVSSETIALPALRSGVLTLQREPQPALSDGGIDAGAFLADAGAPADPCSETTREATIPLPITREWLDPTLQLSDQNARDDLELPRSLSGAPSVTLLGSGLALKPQALDALASDAQNAYLAQHPGDTQGAEAAARDVRAQREAALGARALIETDLQPDSAQVFSLSTFHAIPDVPANGMSADQGVGAVRVCVRAGDREEPRTPVAVVPYRLRVGLGTAFDPKLEYTFRIFAQGEFDAQNKDCSTTGLTPIAKATLRDFQPGRAYTLVFVGAIAPVKLCTASAALWRTGCPRPATDLAARIQRLED